MNTEKARNIVNHCRGKVEGKIALNEILYRGRPITECSREELLKAIEWTLNRLPEEYKIFFYPSMHSRVRRFFNWLKRVASAVFTGFVATASNNPEQEYMK